MGNNKGFKKEKLSGIALDHFAETYSAPSDKKVTTDAFLPYVTQNQDILLIDGDLVEKDKERAKEYFYYLLGQTLPYHQPNDAKHSIFHINDLMFIVDESKQVVPWANNKAEVMQFVKLNQLMGLLKPVKAQTSDPKNVPFYRIPDVKPVIHSDKEHPAPGEE